MICQYLQYTASSAIIYCLLMEINRDILRRKKKFTGKNFSNNVEWNKSGASGILLNIPLFAIPSNVAHFVDFLIGFPTP